MHGTSDHKITYNSIGQSWDSTEHFRVPNTNAYFVGTTKVIDSSTVYTAAAPNLLTLGIQTPMNKIVFTGMSMSTGTISAVSTLTLYAPYGNIDTAGTNIIGLPNPTVNTTATAAVNKYYVDSEIALNAGGLAGRKPYTLTIDVTYFQNINSDIITYLNKVLPIDGGVPGPLYRHFDGDVCTVLSIQYSQSTSTSVLNLNKSFLNISTGTNVLEDVAGSVTVTMNPPVPTYTPKLFQVSTGTWTYIRDL